MKDKILNVIMGISILALIGAGYREFLIHNGKLTSDLNANGYSITNLPAGFFPAETDPTVPSWAKEAAPPSETDPTVPSWAKSQTQPLPPNYDTVSNKAMSALQSYAETDPSVPAWAKAASAPLPPNYATVSNRAMTALQSFTETDPTVPAWAKGETPPLPPGYATVSNKAFNAVQKTGDTMSGNLKFVGGDGQAIGVEVEYHGADDVSTIYAGNSISQNIGSSSTYQYWFPNKTGTFALKSDIPPVDLTDATNYTDSVANALNTSLSSRLSLVSLSATNYTDAAIGAAIAPANPTFSNAVLSVGLGIDTNTVAAINALVEAGDELPIGGAATVGGLLLALAAAVAALKRTKADASALRYAMPQSVALVAENDAATLVCADRAVTNATIASGFSTLNLTFPAEVSGYVRDFYLRITVAAGESAPAISVPQGVTVENAGGAVPEIADGEASAAATTLVWFSETAPGVFTAKSETVKAVV